MLVDNQLNFLVAMGKLKLMRGVFFSNRVYYSMWYKENAYD